MKKSGFESEHCAGGVWLTQVVRRFGDRVARSECELQCKNWCYASAMRDFMLEPCVHPNRVTGVING